ncbi:hypothetical protein D3C87_1435260 [compost metagenome]
MHAALAHAQVRVLGQHGAERLPVTLPPQLHHPQIHLTVELPADLVHRRLGAAVVIEAVRQRAAGQHRDAVPSGLDGLAQRGAKAPAFGQRVPRAPGRHGYHGESSVAVHVAHRHQRAVLQFQAADLVRARPHARRIRAFGDAAPQLRIAAVGVVHVLDEMR